MNRIALVCLIAVTSGALAERAHAAPLLPIADHRIITARQCASPSCPIDVAFPAFEFAPFDESVAIPDAMAAQQGTVGELSMGGSHSVSASNGRATSVFHIIFEAAESVPFTLVGTGSGSGAETSLLFFDVLDTLLIQSSEFDFSHAGMLTAGHQYELVVVLEALSGSGGPAPSGSSDFRFSVVPEPSAALLLATGLVELARRQRRSV